MDHFILDQRCCRAAVECRFGEYEGFGSIHRHCRGGGDTRDSEGKQWPQLSNASGDERAAGVGGDTTTRGRGVAREISGQWKNAMFCGGDESAWFGLPAFWREELHKKKQERKASTLRGKHQIDVQPIYFRLRIIHDGASNQSGAI